MATRTFHVGLIADTHGLLRPEAVAALRGSDYIVHAGDIGDPQILHDLAGIAPVTAVRGNNDRGPWAEELPPTALLQIGDVRLYVVHDLADLDLDPAQAGFTAVVSGHSHRPRSASRDGVLFINPGSAGPRRFHLPVTVGRLVLSPTRLDAELVELSLATTPPSGQQTA